MRYECPECEIIIDVGDIGYDDDDMPVCTACGTRLISLEDDD